MQLNERLHHLSGLSHVERLAFFQSLKHTEQRELAHHWQLWARPEQLAPPGDWRVWLILAGRGFGKTRAGSEWVRQIVRGQPEARIALISASVAEARAVMVEGESGLLDIYPGRRRPSFEPSLRRISWPNGAQAFLYSAAEAESLRGPQHSHAWCDEIGKWDNASERAIRAWDNLLMGLRLGDRPQIVATTTPRAVPLLKRLLIEEAGGAIAVTRGTTYDNAVNLPERFVRDMRSSFLGTALGRQELDGVMLEEVEGALWSRRLLEERRQSGLGEPLARVVVGVDPPVSAHGDECGIVVCGLTHGGTARVLADCSVAQASPERWARAVAKAAHNWNAERVVAESNQGGAMVASVLRAADIALPLKLVHASRGKAARAEPVAALYEAGRVEHAGMFAQLEDQMCGLMSGGGYEGPGHSPDRADALVWALTELMLGRHAGAPRVRTV